MEEKRKNDKKLLISGCALLFVILNAPISLNNINGYIYIKGLAIVISIILIISGFINYLFIKHHKIAFISWILKFRTKEEKHENKK